MDDNQFVDHPAWTEPHIPDARFRVAVLQAGGLTILLAADSQTPLSQTYWEFVEGARIVLVGMPDEPLRLLIDNYVTKDLVVLLSIQPRALHRLRLHLGMPTGATGQRGGARPKAGRKKSKPHNTEGLF